MRIQTLRLQRGWSQEELAALSGVSVRTVQRLERGQTARTESLKALAAVFEIDFNRLRDAEIPEPPSALDAERAAIAHVRDVRDLYVHAVCYLVVIGGLAIINLATSPVYWWVVWPAAGWGVGLVGNGLSVYGKAPFLDDAWERRAVAKVLSRNR